MEKSVLTLSPINWVSIGLVGALLYLGAVGATMLLKRAGISASLSS